MYDKTDAEYMRAALQEAQRAMDCGEVPVGAVVVRNGAIIAVGRNSSIMLHDPSAHAEIMALRKAGAVTGNYRLVDAELYVTLEPCVMCMGALVQARVKRLIFGAHDSRAGAAGSVLDLTREPRLNHTMPVTAGILAEECQVMIQQFFKLKRRSAQ